jgi:hypothetical protein
MRGKVNRAVRALRFGHELEEAKPGTRVALATRRACSEVGIAACVGIVALL